MVEKKYIDEFKEINEKFGKGCDELIKSLIELVSSQIKHKQHICSPWDYLKAITHGLLENGTLTSLFTNCKIQTIKDFNKLKIIEYKRYLETDYWKGIRQKIKKKNNRCQLCSSRERLEIHHNNYDCLFLETEDDLTVLCHRCHSKFHNKEVE